MLKTDVRALLLREFTIRSIFLKAQFLCKLTMFDYVLWAGEIQYLQLAAIEDWRFSWALW